MKSNSSPYADSSAIVKDIIKKIETSSLTPEMGYAGEVIEIADGVAKVKGLKNIFYGEMVEFETGVRGVAINLEEDDVGVIILGDYLSIKTGHKVQGINRLLSVGVSNDLIGRVIDPLGNCLDTGEKINYQKFYPIEKIAPGVIKRKSVDTPVQTGIKAIDSMIPIGRGQRELIIGDRATGKTAVTLDTIINQKGKKLICIYVAIGQKASRVVQVIEIFRRYQAFDHTIVVAANASDPAAMQYLAPFSGCAIGEFFMDQGKDALVVYDDLTKHAWAYRQISLILKRPSGREAYPGDIFYLHSRLLERACKLAPKYGGGSLTALPIIETQSGDMSAYIPTNVISITDGQIYFEPDLFFAGVRPAINVGLSVSRVGGAAQIKAVKQVAGKLKLDLAQYRDMAAFAQFAGELDEKTRSQIERGARLVELLKQGQFACIPVEDQVVLLFCGTSGYLDDVAIDRIYEFEYKFLDYTRSEHQTLLGLIRKEEKLSPDSIEKLKKIITDFKKTF